MRFQLFTDKSVAQCNSALHERLQAKGTKTRPELEGLVEKNGSFVLAVTTKVVRRFARTTRLTAKATRDEDITIIRGQVPDGVGPKGMRILVVVEIAVFVLLILLDNPMIALLTLVAAGIAYVPLRGDYVNSEILLIEVERTLEASPKPPRRTERSG